MPTQPLPNEPSRGTPIAAALWTGAVALAFAPALLSLARVWIAHDYYSHGFFVPLVAYWMFLARRARMRAAAAADRAARGRALGLAVIAAAAALLALGLLLVDPTLQGVALVAAVAGLVLERTGAAGFAQVWFAVAFLLFMVPVPPSVLTPAITGLQLAVSAWAVEILHAAGFSVLREGNVVLLPGGERLFVSEACSGITSIVTLLPLGVVLAWFTQPTVWRGLLLVAAVVPIAMLGNLLRVIGTVVGAQHVGVDAVTSGPVHDAAGVLTFAVACLLLIGWGAWLRRGARANATVAAPA